MLTMHVPSLRQLHENAKDVYAIVQQFIKVQTVYIIKTEVSYVNKMCNYNCVLSRMNKILVILGDDWKPCDLDSVK